MSGHSRWANIKHRKAKGDAAKGQIFTKIGRELALAVKQGGSDPNVNYKLKDVINKAKSNNMPSDNITRSIKKAAGEFGTVNYEEIVYEGFGPGGTAFIVETLTENRNRTGGEIRFAFDRNGGGLSAVSYLFNRKGVIIVEKANYSEDDMMEFAIEAGALDVVTEEDAYGIYTATTDLMAVRKSLEERGLTILSCELEMIPESLVDPSNNIGTVYKLIDLLENNDDVQNVFHNALLPEEEEEE